jgi:hypothetical protein
MIPPIDQQAAKDVLFRFADLMEGQCPFFLVDGTLLGAVREGGFIAHDHDMDVGVWAEDFGVEVLDRLLEAGFKQRNPRQAVEQGYGAQLTFGHIYLDIFPFTRGESYTADMILRKYHLRAHLRPFGLAPISFLGREFLAPDPPEQYLEDGYGPNWRTPTSNWSFRYSPPNLTVVGGPIAKLRYGVARYWRLQQLRRKNG